MAQIARECSRVDEFRRYALCAQGARIVAITIKTAEVRPTIARGVTSHAP